MSNESWINKKWRPGMAIQYIAVCTCDFIIFPVAWTVLQALLGQPVTQWNPLTLQGAGLYHFAMGAVLGVAAWSRGQEKITAMTMNYGGPSVVTHTTTTEGQEPR
jgi:hypothetical protein